MLKSGFRPRPALLVLILVGTLGACSWLCPRRPQTIPVEFTDDLANPISPDDTVGVRPLDVIAWVNPFSEGTVTIQFEDDAPVMPMRQVIPVDGTGRVMVRGDARRGAYKYTVTVTVDSEVVSVVDPYIDVEEDGGDLGEG